jgi:hypothetical protein
LDAEYGDLIELAKQNPKAVKIHSQPDCRDLRRRQVARQLGFVLQDLVNEIGRRLSYDVRGYQGVVNDIGFDGLWFDGKNHIVVEVKTTCLT